MNELSRRMNSLSGHFRRTFGRRVHKAPLDAGFSCPNRDGTLSREGCVFCNERGSGTGLGRDLDLHAQWAELTPRIMRRYGDVGFMAYLQSFSNTYGPAADLVRVLGAVTGHPEPAPDEPCGPLPGLCALAVGTRPDCLDAKKLALLASQPVAEVWLELGLQSANDLTLARINRGHDFAAFASAVEQASGLKAPGGPAKGIFVCAHIMAGLPGEGAEDFLATVTRVAELPVHGIKFHNLYICRGSTLARDWERGQYAPFSQEAYVEQLARALTLLPPNVVVQRLVADPAPGELLDPSWAAHKSETLGLLEHYMVDHDLWQAKALPCCATEIPAWPAPDCRDNLC